MPDRTPTLFTIAADRLRAARRSFGRFTHRSIAWIRGVSVTLTAIGFVAAIVCVGALLIHCGYSHSPEEFAGIRRVMRWVQGAFAICVAFDLIFGLKAMKSSSQGRRPLKWIVDGAVLLTLLPWVYPRPEHPWFAWLDTLLYSQTFLYTALLCYAIMTICAVTLELIGRRTNPSLLLSGSFLVFILLGSMILMLPNCTYGGIRYMDALFVSTSAVCITGLTPVDVYATFTPMGVLVIAVLVQIGGLGVMTFTSFFALFFSGNASIYNQLLLKDMIYSRSMSSLVPTLLYILGFTVVIEIAGAALLWLSIHGTLGMNIEEEITFSLFHSLSAFCNAGFSTLPGGMSNPQLLYGNMSIYWIMSALIVAGSIGFPILVNFRDAIGDHLRRFRARLHHRTEAKRVHLYNMNTKIVIVTFSTLFVAGAVLFWLFERDNTLAGAGPLWQLTQSVFNSVTPRSAGFSSVNPAAFLNVTLVMTLFLMWVGGASQSTAGGVKVNTLAAIILNLRAIVTGRSKVTAFRRTVSTGSIRRANAVVALSLLSYLFYSMALLWLEPDLPARDLLFESCSALFTVGSSLGVTSSLSEASEGLLCTAMFLGRVGIISLLTGLAGHRHETQAQFPSDNIIIN